jgi:hypothetical protein
MARFAVADGQLGLSLAGKHEIAKSMFGKGCVFFGAYELLRQYDSSEATEYVALQNLCQSVEVTLKAILLFADYIKYQPLFGSQKGQLVWSRSNKIDN